MESRSLSSADIALAARIAAAHPLDGRRAVARGNHLAAQNDEPESAVDPMQWAFDQVHLLRINAARTSAGDAKTVGRIAAYSEVLEVLRAARGRARSA